MHFKSPRFLLLPFLSFSLLVGACLPADPDDVPDTITQVQGAPAQDPLAVVTPDPASTCDDQYAACLEAAPSSVAERQCDKSYLRCENSGDTADQWHPRENKQAPHAPRSQP